MFTHAVKEIGQLYWIALGQRAICDVWIVGLRVQSHMLLLPGIYDGAHLLEEHVFVYTVDIYVYVCATLSAPSRMLQHIVIYMLKMLRESAQTFVYTDQRKQLLVIRTLPEMHGDTPNSFLTATNHITSVQTKKHCAYNMYISDQVLTRGLVEKGCARCTCAVIISARSRSIVN